MDPNEIVGTPRDIWVWVAPDWSDWQEGEAAPAGKTGWTKVKIRETLYNDGRIVRNVLDANGAPVKADGTPARNPAEARPLDSTPEYDPKQQERFAQASKPPATVSAPPNQPNIVTQGPGGLTTTPNPNYTPPAGTAGDWHTEGTPDGQGGFDNSRPIMVRTVNGKRETRSLTGVELKDWHEAQQRSKNPGGKTDAEIAAENKEERAPVTTHPGYTQVTTQKSGKTETYYLDPNGNRVAGLPEKPTAAALVGSPTGNTRQRTENGQVIKEAEYVLPDGKKEWRTQTAPAAPDKDQWAPEPAGAPDLPTQIGQYSSGLKAYSQWLDQQVELHRTSGGKEGVSPENATKLMTRRIAVAESAIKEQQGLESTQSGLLSNATTQRGQTLNETQNRRSMAQTVAADVNRRGDERLKFLRPEHAADHVAARQEELRNALAYAGEWGGMRDVPEVDVGGFPALAAARQASMAPAASVRTPGAPPAVPSGADVAAANAATQAGFREAVAPLLPPPAASSPPMQAAAVNPIDQQPIVLPNQLPRPAIAPAPPVSSQIRDDYRADTPRVTEPAPQDGVILTPYTPDQLQPGVPVQIPGAPPGQSVPYPSSDAAVSMAPSIRGLQEARYGEGVYFDPVLASDDLSMRLGIDPEIMRQARASLYG
jgi:hypothetical protein